MSSSKRHILSYRKIILKRLRIAENVMFKKKLNRLHTEIMGFNRSIELSTSGCQHKYSWRQQRLCGRSFKESQWTPDNVKGQDRNRPRLKG